MVTEVVFVSAVGFLRAVYAERHLYRFSSQSLARIGLDVPWDELHLDYSVGYLSFDPWARVFIAHGNDNVRNIRQRVRLDSSAGEDTDGWARRDMLADFQRDYSRGSCPLVSLRCDWTEDYDDPARLPPMLCRNRESREWSLLPGPLRHGRSDSDDREVRYASSFLGGLVIRDFLVCRLPCSGVEGLFSALTTKSFSWTCPSTLLIVTSPLHRQRFFSPLRQSFRR
eukprot:IDg6504t1